MHPRPDRALPRRAAPMWLAAAALTTLAHAQHVPESAPFGTASWLVVPQSRSIALHPSRPTPPIVVTAVHARIEIVDRTARTELDVELRNDAGTAQEAVILMPVPQHAVVSMFDFVGGGAEPSAKILPAAEARSVYDAIVRKLKDPALLEYAADAVLRSTVFPVPAHGTQRVRIGYDHVLEQDGARIDYALPRTESLDTTTPWTIDVAVRTAEPIGTVFSPSHAIQAKRTAPNRFTIGLAPGAERAPGPFLLSVLKQDADRPTASLFAYPDPADGGGYFLLMASVPDRAGAAAHAVAREVTVVLDRSGSMAGGKLDQARAAALQVIEGLADGESFRIVDYASDVACFAAGAVPKTAATVADARQYLGGLRPGGGTNIHDALVEALRPAALDGTLPLVLFLTDGLPTVGTTTEVGIRALVEHGNPAARRVFTFGVGHDVNVPLLDRLAAASRAKATYVAPGEDVELKVGQVYRELYGPVLTDLELGTLDDAGAVDTRRVRELEPERLADLFDGDQLVVLGRYRGDAPLRFRMRGNLFGAPREFTFRFELDHATTRNAFVPRLWASRRIATLVDAVRQAGGDTGAPRVAGMDPFADPKLAELRDEIVRLSTTFGILTEYTAFLATEGTALTDWNGLVTSCGTALDSLAIRTRSGAAAVSQNSNVSTQRAQTTLNYRNGWVDAAQNRIETANVQQVCDRAFFQRGTRWVDGRLVPAGALEPDRTIVRGTPEHEALVDRLVREGRNGVLSLRGEILLQLDTERVLVTDHD